MRTQPESCPFCSGNLRTLGETDGIGLRGCRDCNSVVADLRAPEPREYGSSYYERSYLAFREERLAFLTRLLSRLDKGVGRLAIDCGCGAGFALEVLAETGWRPVGIEPSPSGALLAGQGGRAVAQGSASDLPAATGAAGLVVLLDVLAHLDDPVGAIREAARVLAPGGQILIKTPHRPAWAYRLACVLPGRLGRGLMHLPHQRCAISRRGLRKLLSRAGFEEVRVRSSGEAIPLRSHLKGTWTSRLRALLVASLELLYGTTSSVASGLSKGWMP